VFTFNALAQASTWLLLQHVKWDAWRLSVQVESHSPLQPVPHLEQLLSTLALPDAILNLLVAVDHLRKLHRQVIFISRASVDNDCGPDAHRGCGHMRHEQVAWLTQASLHVEKLNVIFVDFAEDLGSLERVQFLIGVLERLLNLGVHIATMLKFLDKVVDFVVLGHIVAIMDDL